MDNCKTQEVQMNRVLKTMVLFFILTGVSWQAVAFSEADLKKLKSSLKCPKCDLAGADLTGAKLAGQISLTQIWIKQDCFGQIWQGQI